jgi:hypothetical protein
LPLHPALRRTLLAALLAALVVGAGCGGDDDEAGGGVPESGTLPATTTTEAAEATTTTAGSTATTEPAVTLPANVDALITIDVQGSEVSVTSLVSGNNPSSERSVQVGVNTPVRIEVTADRSDEVHLHGYNLTADVEPGTPGTIDFVANAPGLFVIELEDSHLLLAELEVVT